ncbi:MAG: hypothetical protein K9J06_11355 [Flavobacteriales bacterium]|nr:hypothetical protein [Flavobacteriales bacterium]
MNHRPIIIIQSITGVGLFLFWLAFFTIGLAPENPPAGYFTFEHAFPLPDIALGIALLTAAYGLTRGKGYARPLSLACAGGMLFLGLVDFSFNIQNGMYLISTADLVINVVINIWCLGMGTLMFLRMR